MPAPMITSDSIDTPSGRIGYRLAGPVVQVEIPNARLLFPEERADAFNQALRTFWNTLS